ncbi:hypothetical protein L6164_029244 [Bauhinia variegata]|uniref:Uncharacterized protein n=1 Tax=Bauhinia variegata TaxID=167791 RepID=A0ACB9L8X6_BAUVA|nr:hypothetical protein L6164_029244 [Bauhinia variegata]
MNFGFLSDLPWFKAQSNTDFGAASISRTDPIPQPKLEAPNDVKLSGDSWTASTSAGALIKQPKLEVSSNVVKISGWSFSLQSIFPWASNGNGGGKGEFQRPSTINKDLKRRAQGRRVVKKGNGVTPLRFRPYVGYDTHDQAKLLEADLAFLECLEKPHMSTKGDPHIAQLYKTMCINGLRNFLVPYRKYITNLQSGQPLVQFERLCNLRWKRWNLQKNS